MKGRLSENKRIVVLVGCLCPPGLDFLRKPKIILLNSFSGLG